MPAARTETLGIVLPYKAPKVRGSSRTDAAMSGGGEITTGWGEAPQLRLSVKDPWLGKPAARELSGSCPPRQQDATCHVGRVRFSAADRTSSSTRGISNHR